MAHETRVDSGSGIWNIVAPDAVTIDPVVDAQTGVTTELHIFVDFTYDQYSNTSQNAVIHFIGPVTDPTGAPQPHRSYPGLVLQTTFEIRNDLGVPMTGLNLTLTNDDADNIPGRDTQDAHPDDYAHFHQILPTSFSDKLTGGGGVTNTTLRGFDPTLHPAFLGPPVDGENSPNVIDTLAVFQPDAIGHMGGGNPNNTFTLHSEDTPGRTGGSFTLSFSTLSANPTAPDPNIVRVFSEDGVATTVSDHAGDGKTYLLAGIPTVSAFKNDVPSLAFADKSTNTVAGLAVPGDGAVEPAVFGDISLGENTTVTSQNGLTVTRGTFTLEEAATAHLVLNGDSKINNQSVVTITSPDDRGRISLNGTLTVADDDYNFLTVGAHLDGKGMIFIAAPHDTVSVNAVDGVTINVTAGTLNIDHPTDFHGTLGPITTNATINLLEATDVTHAIFDTSKAMLHLLTDQGEDRGDLHITGAPYGLSLNRTLPSDNYIVLQDNSNGNIAIKYV